MTSMLSIPPIVRCLLTATAVVTLARAPVAAQPAGFASEIAAFAERDRTSPPPHEGILFIGSSIFRLWADLTTHMAPLPVFNRAFGGSRTGDVLHYLNRIVLPYRPRIIVYYAGSNDVSAGEPAGAIAARIKEFVERVHAALPDTRIYYVAINKSPEKRAKWPTVDAVNADIRALASTSPHVRYLDLNPVIFDAHGEPRSELYLSDGLHFQRVAYERFTGVIKPALVDAWRELGPKPGSER